MTAVSRALAFVARNGRWGLAVGLLLGVGLPDFAAFMRPLLPETTAAMLYLVALRIGPLAAQMARGPLLRAGGAALALQLAMPVALALAFAAAGVSGSIPLALVLMLAAPTISGAPSITALSGADPAPALRLLAVGAALLPLTALPVFWLVPALGTAEAVLGASARLLAVIAGAAAMAALTRRLFLRETTPQALANIDGLSVIGLALMVIGLMSAVGPALTQRPGELLAVLALAVAANFGLQTAAWLAAGRIGPPAERTAVTVVAGNRNMALFLTALPEETMAPLLLFIGCYQAPMYLTPAFLSLFPRPTQPAPQETAA